MAVTFFAECNKTTAETYSMFTNICGNKIYYAHVLEWHKRFLYNQEDVYDDSISG
jgi:hypothetical protein